MSDETDSYEQTKSVEEYLDRLCWMIADTCDRFYPPEKSADTVIKQLEDETDIEADDDTRGFERGFHTASFSQMAQTFEDIYAYGFDPRERAERDIERHQDKWNLSDEEVDGMRIDWTWWEEYKNNVGGLDGTGGEEDE